MFGIFGWIVLGMLLALVTRLVLRIKDPDGVLVTMLLGIAGALLGGFLAIAFQISDFGESTAFIAALIGAVVMIALKSWVSWYDSRSEISSNPRGVNR